MKQVLLLLFVALLVATPLVAQGKHYPTGNTPNVGSQNNWPFNIYTDWRYSFIVPGSAMPAAKVKITDIAFAPSFYSGRIFTSPNFQMRMNCTTFNNFSSHILPANCFDQVLEEVGCATTVYNGAIRWDCRNTDNWSDIGLQCSFGWDPAWQANFICEIRYQGGSSGASQGCAIRTDPSIPRAYTHNAYTSDPFNAPCWQVPIPGEFAGPKCCLTIDRQCCLSVPKTLVEGQSHQVDITGGSVGDSYAIAHSFNDGVLTSLGSCNLCLSFDPLFLASVQLPNGPIFNGYQGVFTSGTANAKLAVPNFGGILKGLHIFTQALCIGRQGIQCSNVAGSKF